MSIVPKLRNTRSCLISRWERRQRSAILLCPRREPLDYWWHSTKNYEAKGNHRKKQRDKNTGVMSRVGRFIIGKRTNNVKFALERKP